MRASPVLGLVAAIAAGPAVTPVPPEVARGVALVVFVEKLDEPLALLAAPGDSGSRLFVVEKTGRIRVVRSGRVAPEPFVDLSARVSRGSEQGLLGLAFHPRFATNGRFYVDYTDREGDTRIVELTAAKPGDDRATIAGEREILKIDQPYANHNGGHLLMERAGTLLVGTGDGGSGGDPHGNGQNPGSLLGKMLRLAPDAKEGPARTTILARGLRNPWRYAIDPVTNDLFIADVGQNKWEEIDVVPMDKLAGANFGWNVMEGAHCFRAETCDASRFVPPVAEYGHDVGCSITGGFVYRGKALPALAGAYFYADYCTALLRSFRVGKGGGRVVDHWDWKAALDPKSALAQISAFGEDASGEMYVISLRGTIWKLVPAR